ncbi:MAG: tRNA preQ1(34) S-adenosylmethionine ribosyltransferase-isomerase QueA [Pseudomonadota bacterium]
MRVDLFDFHLPPERIALRPAEPRDKARLLCVDPRQKNPFGDYSIRDLPLLLRAGDALVFNDTKVFPAQLEGVRRRGDITAGISFNLHKRIDDETWGAFARPAKKLQVGDHINFGNLTAEITARHEGEVTLLFSQSGIALDEEIKACGIVPLPPYIASKRAPDQKDVSDYQTVFAKHDGSVAAPTAGLHFTPQLLEILTQRRISLHHITLHVGAGTFLPVKSDDTQEHIMHAEWGSVSRETADALNKVRADGGRIIPVGTTSLRLLESASDDDGKIQPFADETSIFMTPGYRFKTADMLLTNFHLPRSTLFMLVSAFSGLETMQVAYKHAIKNGYHFYSYGDACLLSKGEGA